MPLRSVLVILPALAFASPALANRARPKTPQIKVFQGNGKGNAQLAHVNLRPGAVIGTALAKKLSRVDAAVKRNGNQPAHTVKKSVRSMETGRLALNQTRRGKDSLRWSYQHVGFKATLPKSTTSSKPVSIENIEVSISNAPYLALTFGVKSPTPGSSVTEHFSWVESLIRSFLKQQFLPVPSFDADDLLENDFSSEIQKYTLELSWAGQPQRLDLGNYIIEIDTPERN